MATERTLRAVRWSCTATLAASVAALAIGDWGFSFAGWPDWLPVALIGVFYAALFATITFWRPVLLGEIRRRKGHCPACGYDRRGLAAASACPECGRAA